jgi:hypothetical protein
MQKQSSKNIIIIIVIVILAGLAYFYLSGTPTDNSSLVEENDPSTSDANIAAAHVLTLLNQINSLKINKEFFESPSFKSLTDHTVEVLPQNVGKDNPFQN